MYVLAFTVLVAVVPAVFSVDCSRKPDGVYDAGCREFVHCVNHVANVITCNGTYVYDSNTGKCADKYHVPPPCGVYRNCTNIADGRYADQTEHCRTYFTCHAGYFFGHNFCTPGTVFNEALQTCDWPYDVPPPCGTKI